MSSIVFTLTMLSSVRSCRRVRVSFRMFSFRSDYVNILETTSAAAATAGSGGTAAAASSTAAAAVAVATTTAAAAATTTATAATVTRTFFIFLERVGNVSWSSRNYAGTGTRLSRVDWSFVVTI